MKALINSNISHDEFVLINNLLKEYNDMKYKISKDLYLINQIFKDLNDSSNIFIYL